MSDAIKNVFDHLKGLGWMTDDLRQETCVRFLAYTDREGVEVRDSKALAYQCSRWVKIDSIRKNDQERKRLGLVPLDRHTDPQDHNAQTPQRQCEDNEIRRRILTKLVLLVFEVADWDRGKAEALLERLQNQMTYAVAAQHAGYTSANGAENFRKWCSSRIKRLSIAAEKALTDEERDWLVLVVGCSPRTRRCEQARS